MEPWVRSFYSSVQEGMKWLDERYPGWIDKVDLWRLDMGDQYHFNEGKYHIFHYVIPDEIKKHGCVHDFLRNTFGDDYPGVPEGFADGDLEEEFYPELTDTWIYCIKERRRFDIIKRIRLKLHRIWKRYRYHWISLIGSETEKPKGCVICDSPDLEKWIFHIEWKKRMWRCQSCGHCALYELCIATDNFSTHTERASRDLQEIPRNIASLLEVGSPDDFFFLREMHKRSPDTKLFTFDLFKRHTPPYVRSVDEMPQVDFVYSSHTIEHMLDPKDFVRYLHGIDHFLVEVPAYFEGIEDYMKRGGNTQQHYHYFTKKSWDLLFKDTQLIDNFIKGINRPVLQAKI